MHILILGGTLFLGRHLVTAAQERGHTLTLLHRGSRDPYPHLENIVADRAGDLSALEGRRFDAVIDTSGYRPEVVRRSVEALAGGCPRYCFISTISVYPDMTAHHDEETPLVATGEDSYGPLKVECEQVVREAYGPSALIVRPGLIVGAYDPSDRFTYWVERIARGGRVLAPDLPTREVQFIDALSLARFTIAALEADLAGTFNTNGEPVAFGDVLQTIAAVCGAPVRFVWAAEDFLAEQGVAAWMGEESLPLWAPGLDALHGATSSRLARAAGLKHRPLAEVVRETLHFARSRPDDHRWRSGLSPVREAALLDLWDARQA